MKVTLKCSYPAGTPAHKDAAGKTVKGDQKFHEAGSVIDLPRDEAERLIGLGHASAGGTTEAAAPKRPKGEALTVAVAGAIGKLSPLDEFLNKADKPFVGAIEKILGYDISEADRDAGWDAYRKKHPDLFAPRGAAA